MKPKFEPTEAGVEIIDPIERHRYQLTTNGPVSLESASTNQIGFPIDAAVAVTTGSITLPTTDHVLIRDSDKTMVAKVPPSEQADLSHGEYTLDISGPMKVYAKVDSPVYIYSDSEKTYISLADSTQVILSARSFHERPAGTITTTTDPVDVMAAISAFGSALKTTTPERTYPTLRGHPPRLEIGDELYIPDKFDQKETGIRIEIPATLRNTFVVAPLAYYLGADVVPGTSPELITESNYRYSFDCEDGFDTAVKRILRQVFFLDCVVRTEGTTPFPLHERKMVESVLEFEPEVAYDQPLVQRVETFLEIPYSTLQPYLPDWQLETRFEPTAEYIEFLPFVTNDLAVVKVQDEPDDPSVPDPTAKKAINEFTRDSSDFVRSASSHNIRGNKTISTSNNPPQLPSIQQSWTGIDGTEITSTAPLVAYESSIGRTPKDGPIEIEVICNDPDMRAELESVNGTYGTRKELPFETTIHYELTTSALAEVLARDSDFLHYIGHIDTEGFQCSDGKLNAATVDTVGTKAFLLNACQSHEQGLHLIKAGSIGGIVTLGNVINSGAVSIGSLIAQLLNLGFPLYGALDIARQESVVGQQYRMVGDARTTIAQSETRIPNACLVNKRKSGISVDIVPYISADMRRGGVFSPYLDPVELYNVVPNSITDISVTNTQLEKFYKEGKFPVLLNGKVRWSNELLSTNV
ncbi:hypothetical protein HYG81_11745 [Natrinema zhouii]|uniref:CHAT domain-containing protein n=1 Tax=Natrinema zhouii TaxID=1710539 RepID=A0A7D6GT62_9EURY|nr:hypothetical protein [Natrinema zhouii]QLK24784.1 hypothetical protein HYG81_11745 [Natrinema zhouii]